MAEVQYRLGSDTTSGMTEAANLALNSAAQKAKELGITLQVVGANDPDKSGHKSHFAGTEWDVKGVKADGTPWTAEERVEVAKAVAPLGVNRFGFYPGGTLHFGFGPPGGVNNAAWGPGGKLSGVPVSAFHPAEQDFVKQVKAGAFDIKKMQADLGVTVDGIIGPETLAALRQSLPETATADTSPFAPPKPKPIGTIAQGTLTADDLTAGAETVGDDVTVPPVPHLGALAAAFGRPFLATPESIPKINAPPGDVPLALSEAKKFLSAVDQADIDAAVAGAAAQPKAVPTAPPARTTLALNTQPLETDYPGGPSFLARRRGGASIVPSPQPLASVMPGFESVFAKPKQPSGTQAAKPIAYKFPRLTMAGPRGSPHPGLKPGVLGQPKSESSPKLSFGAPFVKGTLPTEASPVSPKTPLASAKTKIKGGVTHPKTKDAFEGMSDLEQVLAAPTSVSGKFSTPKQSLGAAAQKQPLGEPSVNPSTLASFAAEFAAPTMPTAQQIAEAALTDRALEAPPVEARVPNMIVPKVGAASSSKKTLGGGDGVLASNVTAFTPGGTIVFSKSGKKLGKTIKGGKGSVVGGTTTFGGKKFKTTVVLGGKKSKSIGKTKTNF